MAKKMAKAAQVEKPRAEKPRAEKPRETEMPTATETKTKPVRLDLTPEVHHMLRVVAAEKGKPMAVFAREVVEKAVQELYGKRGRS